MTLRSQYKAGTMAMVGAAGGRIVWSSAGLLRGRTRIGVADIASKIF
jgi:hypothetical protein